MSAERRELDDAEVMDLLEAVWSLDHALRARSRRMEAELGVTGPQRLVIRLLGREGEVAAGALAGMLCVHPSTLTGVLQRLEEGGYVERREDPADRRRSLLRLTDRGRSMDLEREGTVEAAVRDVLERSDPETVARAADLLRTLARSLLS